jgi:cytochrome c oxidase subunit II
MTGMQAGPGELYKKTRTSTLITYRFLTYQHPLLVFFLSLFIGCGATQQFTAIPPALDRDKVPRQTIEMTAENFHFTPDEIRVNAGTLVKLKITATEGTHGFKLAAFGIDEKLEEHQTKELQFFAPEKGEYGFKCSHFCGIGHFGMNGKIVVQ